MPEKVPRSQISAAAKNSAAANEDHIWGPYPLVNITRLQKRQQIVFRTPFAWGNTYVFARTWPKIPNFTRSYPHYPQFRVRMPARPVRATGSIR